MTDYLRLRQICLVAPELGPAERAITEVLGLNVCYRDGNVGKYGLENALWPIGDMFLEIVAPTQPDTAAGRFLERSQGRGGYMVIFDCSDPARRATHARDIGVKVITDITHDAYTGVQLHPRDCRAAMIEFNKTAGGDKNPDLYAPAGPNWTQSRKTDVTSRIRAIELTTPDPTSLAAHWSAIIEHPTTDASPLQMQFPQAALRFVKSGDSSERLATLEIETADAAAMKAQAEKAGLSRTDRGFFAVGVEWVPVQP